MQILGLCGSLRKGSYNRMLLMAAAELCGDVEMVVFEGLGDIPAYNADVPVPESVRHLDQLIRDTDGLLIATPEYNSSIPGVLKNALDWISVPFANNPVMGKPAAVVGSSTGMFGAVWAQHEARKVLTALGGAVVDTDLPIARADEVLTADGLVDPDLRVALGDIVGTLVARMHESVGADMGDDAKLR
ncbi:NADPH-dependent FMN reductase [Saccharopolyspora sp. ASAGF58]|uniref:NADPH-dependent FMN reductase n=1 Tax=Saccharopolyspora sp. ASAGF58 TaxID=2719023 RepID=UPI00144029CC|nr:NAD(P)H-dependent oxidoreductase [Saccharopolyspora sp. ASAGF58]QIZ34726.1 NAD(P)H-dependent oxidoreductase [Saccharopolyspora sp. ASAGF58]